MAHSKAIEWAATSAVILFVALLPAEVLAEVTVEPAPGRSGVYRVSFRFRPPIAPERVSVAGTFNEWKKDAHPLRNEDGDGTWEIALVLKSGRYAYKFVVDQRTWLRDQANPLTEPDGFGEFNSVVEVGITPESRGGKDAARDDGQLRIYPEAAKFHDPRADVELAGDALFFKARFSEGDIERVFFETPGGAGLPMRFLHAHKGQEVYGIERPNVRGAWRYRFRVEDGPERWILGPRGVIDKETATGWFVPSPSAGPAVPDWVRDAVFYQIFPDRFANGDPSNDPPGTESWGTAPRIDNFFGGDLEGVRTRLGTLEELGVTAIYFNPLFAAPSNHKYDTADYLAIDPHLGTNALLKALVSEAHARGIRVILDGVFNHSGDRFWAFQDVLKNGAESRYKDWYFIRKFPVVVKEHPEYEAWWGFAHLPKLNTGNPETRKYLLGVAAHWIREAGIDGWRLDVPNEVPHDFWREFRTVVKKAKRDAYIVGEIWTDGSPWLEGDQFDAVMNYTFRDVVLKWVSGGSAGDLDAGLGLRHRYPLSIAQVLYNPLGTHDTIRLLTACGGSVERAKLAVLLQMTFPGAPAIYYGDEVGLSGDKDPDCRRSFPWELGEQNRELLEHYRKLIRLRKTHPALSRGAFRAILVDEPAGVYAFLREYPGETICVVFNPSSTEHTIALPLSSFGLAAGKDRRDFADLASGETVTSQDGWLRVEVPPVGGRMFRLTSE